VPLVTFIELLKRTSPQFIAEFFELVSFQEEQQGQVAAAKITSWAPKRALTLPEASIVRTRVSAGRYRAILTVVVVSMTINRLKTDALRSAQGCQGGSVA
jgi:hypothetical protein